MGSTELQIILQRFDAQEKRIERQEEWVHDLTQEAAASKALRDSLPRIEGHVDDLFEIIRNKNGNKSIREYAIMMALIVLVVGGAEGSSAAWRIISLLLGG